MEATIALAKWSEIKWIREKKCNVLVRTQPRENIYIQFIVQPSLLEMLKCQKLVPLDNECNGNTLDIRRQS